MHAFIYVHVHTLSHARTQALSLLTLPELPPQWTSCAGDWWQATQGLPRASIGSFGYRLGEVLLCKEELTQRAKQLVHVVQLLLFIPLWRGEWPEGFYGLRELP